MPDDPRLQTKSGRDMERFCSGKCVIEPSLFHAKAGIVCARVQGTIFPRNQSVENLQSVFCKAAPANHFPVYVEFENAVE